MDDGCSSIQLVDVVSPTIQTEESSKDRIAEVLSETELTQPSVIAKPPGRSPSCELSKAKRQKDGHVVSVYAQRHRSTPSRRRKVELFEPVASPLRMVLTQSISSPEYTASSRALATKENASETSEYASINMKKESLRKLLAELSTSPRSTTNGVLSPGCLRAESLRVSPMKSDVVGAPTTVSQVAKASIALSPLHHRSPGIKEQESTMEEYIARIAQLEETVRQRESEMKELMMVVLSNDLLKASSDSDKIAALTEQLKCKENELRQMVEFLADEQKRKEDVKAVGTQTDKQLSNLAIESNKLDVVQSKANTENLCPRCRERMLEDGDGDSKTGLSRVPSKKQLRANSKGAPVQAKSVPVRRTKNTTSTPLQNTKKSSQSSKNIHILEQLLQSPRTDTHELANSQTLPLAQFALSPPASLTESSAVHSPVEFHALEEQIAPSQYLLNTSVSAISEFTCTPEANSKLDPSVADPLFEAVFSILTGIAK